MKQYLLPNQVNYYKANLHCHSTISDGKSTPEELVEAQQRIYQVKMSESVADYLIALVGATRSHSSLRMGASPRASRALYQASKTWAAMKGRDFVTPDDIQELAIPVLAHRLLLTNQARMTGATQESVMRQILSGIPVPPEMGDEIHG